MTAQRCQVHTCTKVRRDGRPVCNRCLRRVGEPVLHRWFGYKRAIAAHPGQRVYVDRLEALETTMILNASVYQQIRDTGQRPRWNVAGERWENPRNVAFTILDRAIATHAFGRDPLNDAAVLTRVVAELFPAEP
ncbi:hypothetical protein A5721_18845 [Mycobacterium vulneris]|nr:hypothetical protein A5721_18845 [Mycolicibacterium vulneris]